MAVSFPDSSFNRSTRIQVVSDSNFSSPILDAPDVFISRSSRYCSSFLVLIQTNLYRYFIPVCVVVVVVVFFFYVYSNIHRLSLCSSIESSCLSQHRLFMTRSSARSKLRGVILAGGPTRELGSTIISVFNKRSVFVFCLFLTLPMTLVGLHRRSSRRAFSASVGQTPNPLCRSRLRVSAFLFSIACLRCWL